jgi:putative endonuclease
MALEWNAVNMKHNQRIGKWGEDLAAQYLEEKGYAVLFKNWKTPYGELDLIVQKDGTISIVEVKTRTRSDYGWPEESITPSKQEHLINASQFFFDEHREYSEYAWQIDVVAILLGKNPDQSHQIKHYENAITSE